MWHRSWRDLNRVLMHHFRHRTQEPSVLAALTMRKLGKGKGRDLMLSSRILGSTILIKGNWPHTPRQRKLRWRGICKDLQRSACWQVQIYFAEPSYEGYQKKGIIITVFSCSPGGRINWDNMWRSSRNSKALQFIYKFILSLSNC